MSASRPGESHSVRPIRSLSISVSRYCDVKLESAENAVDFGGVEVSFLEEASEELRKLMKDVFPEFLVPTTRMLRFVSSDF